MTGPTSNNDGASRKASAVSEEAPVHVRVQNSANNAGQDSGQEVFASQVHKSWAEPRHCSRQRQPAETSLYRGRVCRSGCAMPAHRRKPPSSKMAAADRWPMRGHRRSTLEDRARDRMNHCHFTIAGITTEQRRNKSGLIRRERNVRFVARTNASHHFAGFGVD
jgi:hypothetical protein